MELYQNVITRNYKVMPDHIHVILEIRQSTIVVGAIHESPLQPGMHTLVSKPITQLERRRMLIPKVIGWYKMNTAKVINQLENRSGFALWQRNYHDIVIKDEKSYKRIAGYIMSNDKRE
jgi:REP element-mobilizing transposase RayT